MKWLLILSLVVLVSSCGIRRVETHQLPGRSTITMTEYSTLPIIGMKIVQTWQYDPNTGKDVLVSSFSSQPKKMEDIFKGLPVIPIIP
jgi:hypothetical protein